MNIAILSGRITRDIEVREIPDGTHVAEFSIAVKRRNKDEVDYVDIQAWRQNADFLSSYAHKGTTIGVVGRYRVDKYTDRDGVERKKHYFMVENVEILNQPKSENQKSVEESNRDFNDSIQDTPYVNKFGGHTNLIDEEDLPFY